MIRRKAANALTGLTAFAAFLMSSAPVAQAHVVLTTNKVHPGFAELKVRVLHGCEDSPTHRVTLKVPDDFKLARPVVEAGWEISGKSVTYSEPIEVHGEVLNKGYGELVWSGGYAPSDFILDLDFTVLVPRKTGETFRFFAVQECEGEEPQEWAMPVTVVGGFTFDSMIRNMPLILGAFGLLIGTIALVITVARSI